MRYNTVMNKKTTLWLLSSIFFTLAFLHPLAELFIFPAFVLLLFAIQNRDTFAPKKTLERVFFGAKYNLHGSDDFRFCFLSRFLFRSLFLYLK